MKNVEVGWLPAPQIATGVQPLHPGLSTSFILRRLHSLSGIVPIGAFLIEHFVSNAFATNRPRAYADQVKMLTGIPFLVWVEATFIWFPLLYHSLYGFYIWYRGDSNIASYPWTGNWLYTAQRWTGAISFFYIGFHTWEMRFAGIELKLNPDAAFAKVQASLSHPWILIFYIVGTIAASWHFSYGVWLFAAKWGITIGDAARRRFGYACLGLAVLLIAVGLMTIRAFLKIPG